MENKAEAVNASRGIKYRENGPREEQTGPDAMGTNQNI